MKKFFPLCLTIVALASLMMTGCSDSIVPPDYGEVVEEVKVVARRSGRISFNRASLRRYADGSVAVYAVIEGRRLVSKGTPSTSETLQKFTSTPIGVLITDSEGQEIEKGITSMIRGRRVSTGKIIAIVKYYPKVSLGPEHTVILSPIRRD